MQDVLTLAVLALPVIGIWLLVVKPAQRRTREAQAVSEGVQVGQEVMTGSGLYGTVTAIDEDTVHLAIAPGVTVRFARRAIAVVDPDAEPEGQIENRGPDN
ncbi:MAG TPA: preprotein translocase subunit YajC [Actinomycetes bacterium]|nr:preprotein translocase subunit YajC [Actinomycetes bacterium]